MTNIYGREITSKLVRNKVGIALVNWANETGHWYSYTQDENNSELWHVRTEAGVWCRFERSPMGGAR